MSRDERIAHRPLRIPEPVKLKSELSAEYEATVQVPNVKVKPEALVVRVGRGYESSSDRINFLKRNPSQELTNPIGIWQMLLAAHKRSLEDCARSLARNFTYRRRCFEERLDRGKFTPLALRYHYYEKDRHWDLEWFPRFHRRKGYKSFRIPRQGANYDLKILENFCVGWEFALVRDSERLAALLRSARDLLEPMDREYLGIYHLTKDFELP